MIIFGSIRLYFLVLGIHSSQSNQNYLKNVKSVTILFVLVSSVFSSLAFFIYEAETLEERENIFFDIITLGTAAFYLAIYIWKTKAIFKFMANIERVIQKSVYNSIILRQILKVIASKLVTGLTNNLSKNLYMETNQRAEKLCQILHFALTKVSVPCVMMPKLIISYFLYYAMDERDEAFQLPTPKWYNEHA